MHQLPFKEHTNNGVVGIEGTGKCSRGAFKTLQQRRGAGERDIDSFFLPYIDDDTLRNDNPSTNSDLNVRHKFEHRDRSNTFNPIRPRKDGLFGIQY